MKKSRDVTVSLVGVRECPGACPREPFSMQRIDKEGRDAPDFSTGELRDSTLSTPCGEVEDVVGALTPVVGGVAQVFHDLLVELRLLLEEGEKEGRQEEG